MATKFRFLKSTIYKLKRRFGESITVKRTTNIGTIDYTTGAISDRVEESIKIKQVIFLPFALSRNFSYDLTYLAANKNFTYGATYDLEESTIICDKKDFKDFTVDMDMTIIKGTQTFQVKKIEESYQNSSVLIIRITELKGER